MYDNLRKYTNIYEMMFNYVRQCMTKNTSLRHKCCSHKSFKCKTVFFNRGFSYEKLRITANNRDKLRKAVKFQCAPCLTLKVISGTAP